MWGMHSKHAITWEETNRLLQINYTSNDSNRTMCVVQDELIESSRTMFVRMNELLSDETPSQPTMIAGITMIDQLIEDSFFLPGEPLPEQDLPSIIVDQRDASHAMSGRTIFDLDAKVDAILASYSR
jgi:hypothetical protein